MDWLRSEDLKEEKNVTASIVIIAVDEPVVLCRCHGAQSVPLNMSRIYREYLEPDANDRSVTADHLLRQEPDEDENEEEEEDEEEGDRKEDDEDEDTDDGYSE